MVVRKRLRAVLFPLSLYCVSGAVGGFFLWHAVNGERGLKTRGDYERKIADLRTELVNLREVRRLGQLKINLLRGQTIDADLLREQAEVQLGRIGKNDLVVIFNDRRL
ncbi:MAG TPA: septum formation initiator family protein [Methylovirgula sp.]